MTCNTQDEAYLQQLTEACYDTIRRLLGPRKALSWGREIRVLSELLYYTLTTGAGQQTLGEEYCDVVLAAGRGSGPPSILRRGALILFQSLGPYWTEKQFFSSRNTTTSTNIDNAALVSPPPPPPPPSSSSLYHRIQHRMHSILHTIPPRAHTLLQQSTQFYADHGTALLRLHLAVFYITGVYYQLSKRFSGVRYLYAGRETADRPMYRALGVLLAAQVAVTAGVATWSRAHKGKDNSSASDSRNAYNDKIKAKAIMPVVVFDEDGQVVREDNETTSSVPSSPTGTGTNASGKKCPLCLSPRVVPTATPCGHVFCWQCIAEWAARKPECPLCRSEAPPSSLVVAYHTDL